MVHRSCLLNLQSWALACAYLFKESLGLPTQPAFPEEQELGMPGVSSGRELLTPTC